MATTQLEKRTAFLREANERLTHFEQSRTAFRAEDVRQYFIALTTRNRAARPKPIKI